MVGGAGDAAGAIKVGVGRAAFDALFIVVDGVSDALAAFAPDERELSIAEVVEVGGSVDNGSEVVGGDGEAENTSVVADDEAADTAEHQVHAFVHGHFILVSLHSHILIIHDIVGVKVLDAGVVGDVGNEERVNLGG